MKDSRIVEDETMPFDEQFGPRVGACPKCGDEEPEYKRYVSDEPDVIVWKCSGCGYKRATPALDAAA